MPIGDLPKFPPEFKPRGAELVTLLEQDKNYSSELLKNTFMTLGTLTVDASGIRIQGEFGSFVIDSSEFQAIVESMNLMMDFMKSILRDRFELLKEKRLREMFVKIGDKTLRLKIRPLFLTAGKVSLSAEELKNTDLPVIEITPTEYMKQGVRPMLDLLAWHVSGRERPALSDYCMVKVHRVEDLIDWLDWEWEKAAEALYMMVPMMHLTRKEAMVRLSESYVAFWDEVLRRCGL